MHSAKKKKNEKIKNDDLDLFYVYFSSIMSYRYPFIEKKTAQNLPKKVSSDVFTRSLDSEHSGWDRFNFLIFYQMLNKKSKQHSLLHFLIGKLDQIGFPNPSKAI